MSNFVGNKPNPLSIAIQAAKKAFKSKKGSGSGKAIKNIGANVPKNQLDKLTRDIKILDQKAKATKAMVDQTNFEIKNPQFTKGKFTFDASRKDVPKRNKKSAEMFEASKGRKFNKGGRVGLKRGTFPDLSGDGETTMKDILIGRGVIPKPKDKKKKMMAKKSKSPMDKAVKKKNKKRFV